tara:strand:- start:1914 stop:2174 length:261 start_codon:yes stop_codon:yes gene_type:complete
VSLIPIFLQVTPGDYVLIEENLIDLIPAEERSNWIGKIIKCIGGARDPKAWTLFQVIDIDKSEIRIIQADQVKRILRNDRQRSKSK